MSSNLHGDLIYSLIITLFGMGVVFIVLVFLQYILKGMKLVFRGNAKKEKNSKPAVNEQASNIALEESNTKADDLELIAVISAAIAASLGTQSNIVIRNIRRIDDMTPTWGKAGRSEAMANRF